MIRTWPLTRKLAGGLIARLTRRHELVGKAEIWGKVWAARAEWRDGYPIQPHPARAAGADGNGPAQG